MRFLYVGGMCSTSGDGCWYVPFIDGGATRSSGLSMKVA